MGKGNETWPIYIILQKKIFYEKILQNMTRKIFPDPFLFLKN